MKDVKGKSKGFGFVKFKSPEKARKAVESTKYSTSNVSYKDLNYGNYWGLKATTSHKKESIKSGSLGSSSQGSLATPTTPVNKMNNTRDVLDLNTLAGIVCVF
ncbi:hypothetical protein Q3G72_029388 [Acer saccharum]|nr:hypothetical protein Q3G72_029388 [Acer saccharum]